MITNSRIASEGIYVHDMISTFSFLPLALLLRPRILILRTQQVQQPILLFLLPRLLLGFRLLVQYPRVLRVPAATEPVTEPR